MKNLIAFIFVIIMIIIDNDLKIDRYFNFSNKNTKIEKFVSNKENILWIFNPIEISDREWFNFGSRRHLQQIIPIIEICNDSVKFHLSKKFNIRIFNDTQLDTLIPEYVDPIVRFPLISTLLCGDITPIPNLPSTNKLFVGAVLTPAYPVPITVDPITSSLFCGELVPIPKLPSVANLTFSESLILNVII